MKLQTRWYMTVMGDNIEILDVLRDTDFYDEYLINRAVIDTDYPDQITSTIPINGIDDLFSLVTLLSPLKGLLVNFYCNAKCKGIKIHVDLTKSQHDCGEIHMDEKRNAFIDKLTRIRAILDE